MVKLFSQLLYKSGNDKESASNNEITPEDMALLRDIFKEDVKTSSPNDGEKKEYKI
jgi:hypothetical protein